MKILVGVFVIFQIHGLVRWVEQSNRNLALFFEAIEDDDFSQTFPTKNAGGAFRKLNHSLNKITKKLQAERAGKEDQYRYLQIIIQHVGVGLLAFAPDGKVDLVNNAAKKLLFTSQIKTIDALRQVSDDLVDMLLTIKAGERKLLRLGKDGLLYNLSVQVIDFRRGNQYYRLASLQNIKPELEEAELEAWQNLIRVLAHEIMTSITPIVSLSSTAKELLCQLNLENAKNGRTNPDTVTDIESAVETIEERSRGLLHFASAYRSLSHIPKPKFEVFKIDNLFERVAQLAGTQIAEGKTILTYDVDPKSLELTADQNLIEQVMLNLVMNSIQSLSGVSDGQIHLHAGLQQRGKIAITVTDNGVGIPPEIQDKIFVPFFTTKENGSGIGLSLSRQILQLHHATISVYSEPSKKTTFTITF